MDSVLNLPARAIQVETSVHGQPVAGIVSTQDRGNTPTLLRSNTVLMQKVAELSLPASEAFPACKTQPPFHMMPCLCRRCRRAALSVHSMEQSLSPLACECMVAGQLPWRFHHALSDITFCIQSLQGQQPGEVEWVQGWLETVVVYCRGHRAGTWGGRDQAQRCWRL